MSHKEKPGHYQDEKGDWHADRRIAADRRNQGGKSESDERRATSRRKSDRERLDREHKEMIRDALDDFSSGKEEG